MNKGLTETLTENFPSIVPVVKPLVELPEFINPYRLSGFIEGEGCFFVSVADNKQLKTKFSVYLLFKLTQHSRDIELLKNIAKFLGCGFIPESNTQIADLICKNFSEIEAKIIPFFEKYPLRGTKRLDYAEFYKVFQLMKNKSHLQRSSPLPPSFRPPSPLPPTFFPLLSSPIYLSLSSLPLPLSLREREGRRE